MRRWLLSYTSLLVSCNQCSNRKQPATSTVDDLEMRLVGLLSVDIDLETIDLNQCESTKLEQGIHDLQQANELINRQASNANQLTNQLNAQDIFKLNNLIDNSFNNSIINQPQALTSSPTLSNNNSTSNDKTRNRFTNRIMLNFERTHKCHQATSKVFKF